MTRDEDCIAEGATLTTGQKRLSEISNCRRKIDLRPPQQVLRTNSVHKAEVNKLNYTVGIFNYIVGTAWLSDHMPTLQKGYIFTLFRNLQQ